MTNQRLTAPPTRLDDAARAGWLYYVAGNTQDEIAQKLGVSRQTAQRLVAMAVAEKLVKVRLDHPIGRCMDLAEALRDRWSLRVAEVVRRSGSAERCAWPVMTRVNQISAPDAADRAGGTGDPAA